MSEALIEIKDKLPGKILGSLNVVESIYSKNSRNWIFFLKIHTQSKRLYDTLLRTSEMLRDYGRVGKGGRRPDTDGDTGGVLPGSGSVIALEEKDI